MDGLKPLGAKRREKIWLVYQKLLVADKKMRVGHLCLVAPDKVAAHVFGADGHKDI